MAIEREAVLVLLRQVLLAKPELRQQIKGSREVLFGIIARIYTLDEMRREISFDRDEIQDLFNALLDPAFAKLNSERTERFFEQIREAASHLAFNEEFRHVVATALIEAVKARLGSD